MTTLAASPSVLDAKYVGCWLTWVGATRGCLNFLGVQCDNADVAGQSGYAFRLIIREGVCPSGPTLFPWASLLSGVWRLGRSTLMFHAQECHSGEWKNARTREHCAVAFELARREIEAGRPCVIWGAYIPEFALCTGVEEESYRVDSYRTCTNEPQPPVRFDELEAPGGLYVLGFPTVMKLPAEVADRDAIAQAAEIMSVRKSDETAPTGLAAFDFWIDQLQSNRALASGNAYNAQCWAEARRLGERFVERVAGRNPHVPKLRDAHAALKRSADAMERVAKIFPFPGLPDHLKESSRSEAADILRTARTADADATTALRDAHSSWERPKRKPGDS